MTRFAFVLVTLGLCTLTSCHPPVYGTDSVLVMQRWSGVYTGVCPSWLTSHKTGQRYCASPAFDARPEVAAVAAVAFDETKVDQASLMAAGKTVYGNVCVVCHGPEGKGQPGVFPPLAGSADFYGDAQKMAKIVVGGLSGEIVVQGVTYNGAMPAQGALSNYEIAAVTTYVRNSFGNSGTVVLPTDVAAVR